MSRSGYSDDIDNWPMIRWRGMVASAIRGKRGQEFLKSLLTALDAMPEKRLIAHELEAHGEVCAIGALGKHRGISLADVDVEDDGHHKDLSRIFDIAKCLVMEVEWMNDDWHGETPEHRWSRVRAWVKEQIKLPTADAAGVAR